MKPASDLKPLANRVLLDIGSSPSVVGIDGIDGIGKTSLAKDLALLLAAPVISLDEFLVKNRGCYVEALDTSLEDSIRLISGTAVIEGTCLLAAAERFNVKIDTLIYLKRTHLGLWADEDWCDFSGDPEEVIAREEDELFSFLEWERHSKNLPPPEREDARLSGLRSELIRYHGKYLPHKKAQYVYEVEHA